MSRVSSKTARRLVIFAVICLAVGAFGMAARARKSHELEKETSSGNVLAVSVIAPKVSKGTEDIILPGRVEAWHEASIYARTNGYISDFKADIGSHVKAGDVLADIETPEIDAQLRQAEADLATANANNMLAQSTAKRWKDLRKTDSVTQQEADEKTGDALAKAAAVTAAEANRDRLQELKGFQHITAPFDGVITARNVDIGALVNAGSAGTAQELFHIAEKDKLRIYTEVPQNYTQRLSPGMTAELHFAEYPGRVFDAKLSRDASALDPATRTMRVEFELDNAKEEVLPGGYTEVHIKVESQTDGIRLPVNTLLYRANGVHVATVDPQLVAHVKPVTLGRDFGTEVEITAGLQDSDQIIVNPPDSLADNTPVRIAPKDDDKKPAAGAKTTDGDKKDGKKDVKHDANPVDNAVRTGDAYKKDSAAPAPDSGGPAAPAQPGTENATPAPASNSAQPTAETAAPQADTEKNKP